MKVDRLQNTIADATILIMAILILRCCINTTEFSYFGTNILTDLVRNWENRPIIDIIKGNGSCPFSYEPIYEDIWPGVKEGCFCDTIKIGTCPNKNYQNCQNVPPMGELELHIWDGVLLCAKKHDKDYFYFSQQNKRKGCGLEEKICGRLDNLGRTYCVRKNEDCFINDILIYSELSNISNESNSINLGQGKYLKFTKGESSLGEIIIDIKPSFGEVCIDPLEKNINFTPYLLLDQSKIKYTCSHKVSDSFFDSRYKKIDQCDLIDYYESNNILPILNSLPKYESPPLGTKIELYTRGYLGWKDSCVKDEFVSPKNIKDSLEKLHRLNFYQSAISGVSKFYFFMVFGLLFFKVKYVLFNKDDGFAEESIIIADGINYIGIMIGLIFAIHAYATGSELVNFFMALRDLECGDPITNKILFSFADELNSNINKNLTSLFMFIITMILIPLNLIVMNYRSPYNTNVEIENYVLLPLNGHNEDNYNSWKKVFREVF